MTPESPDKPANTRELEQATIDARAALDWGTSLEKVESQLLERGLSRHHTARIIASLQVERRAQVRWRGVRDLLYGLGSAALAAVGWYAFMQSGPSGSGKGHAMVLGLALVGSAAAPWFISRGLWKIATARE